jgi:DNA polymerase III epsilon subunit-like protein
MQDFDLIKTIKQMRRYVNINLSEVSAKVVHEAIDFGEYTNLAGELTPQEIMLYACLSADQKAVTEIEYSEVIAVERGESSGSKSPKWTMDTRAGERFWVLEHQIAERNTITVFDQSGWGELLRKMPNKGKKRFTQTPILVQLEKDSAGFYRPLHVKARPEGASDDVETILENMRPEAKIDAVSQIRQLMNGKLYTIDTETTGFKDAQVISLAVVDQEGKRVYKSMVKPTIEIEAGATAVHGWTMDLLEDAISFNEAWKQLKGLFPEGLPDFWAWNAEYDQQVIANSMKACNMTEPMPKIHCAMKLYAQFNGDWDDKRQQWKSVSLKNACAQMKVPDTEVKKFHDAENDALVIVEVFKAVANPVVNTEDVPF